MSSKPLFVYFGRLSLLAFVAAQLAIGSVWGQPAPAAPAEATPAPAAVPAPATPAAATPPVSPEKTEKAAVTEKTEKSDKSPDGKKKKRTPKLAEDKEDPTPPEKDPATYELSNKKYIDEYTELDRRPWDRGEHLLISAMMGAIGGGVVGGLIGFSGFNKDDETKTLNSFYSFGGAGAGVGVLAGITVTFFERKKVEQFAIGKFLLKYSWYGAIGGALIGAGIGLIPYASSGDYSDIAKYGGYGAGVGLAAGLALFFIDLPDHLKLYTYKRDDQSVILLTLRF